MRDKEIWWRKTSRKKKDCKGWRQKGQSMQVGERGQDRYSSPKQYWGLSCDGHVLHQVVYAPTAAIDTRPMLHAVLDKRQSEVNTL